MQLKIVAALEITRDIPRGVVEVVVVQVVEEEMMAKLCATAATGSYSWQKHMSCGTNAFQAGSLCS